MPKLLLFLKKGDYHMKTIHIQGQTCVAAGLGNRADVVATLCDCTLENEIKSAFQKNKVVLFCTL